MNTDPLEDAWRASRLIQWGLRPDARPAQEPEYRALIERYRNVPPFREMVQRIADGLELVLLEVAPLGIVLGPGTESVFAMRQGEFVAAATSSADDRLLYGLIMVAIATRIYPRARDLEEEAHLARQPVSVEEIEEMMRSLCERFAEAARGAPDPAAGDGLTGFYEAWRVYQNRIAVRQTEGERKARGTTRRMIERVLDRLCELGCFQREDRRGQVHYQPLWRYQVLVRELAATAIFERMQAALNPAETNKEA